MPFAGWLGLDPRLVNAQFAVEKVSLGHISQVCLVSVSPPMLHTHLFVYHWCHKISASDVVKQRRYRDFWLQCQPF